MVLSVLSAPSFCNPAGCIYPFVIHQYDAERMLFAARSGVSRAVRLAGRVDLVSLVHLVCLVQPNKQDKPNKRDRSLNEIDQTNKTDAPERLTDFSSILLDRAMGAGFPGNTMERKRGYDERESFTTTLVFTRGRA